MYVRYDHLIICAYLQTRLHVFDYVWSLCEYFNATSNDSTHDTLTPLPAELKPKNTSKQTKQNKEKTKWKKQTKNKQTNKSTKYKQTKQTNKHIFCRNSTITVSINLNLIFVLYLYKMLGFFSPQHLSDVKTGMLVHSDVRDIRELRPLKQSVCCCVSYTLVLWYSINMMGIYMYYGTINKRLADSFPDKGMIIFVFCILAYSTHLSWLSPWYEKRQ